MAAVNEQTMPPRSLAKDDDLTDEQIEQLLARATERLKQKSQSQEVAKSNGRQDYTFPKLQTGKLEQVYVSTKGEVATLDKRRVLEETRRMQKGIRKVEDPVAAKKAAAAAKRATAGPSWYNLPSTNLTPELKRDLQLLKMRGVLDPHRHYKKENGKMEAPEYSQVGTVVEGATEFFTGRIENKKRKRTFVEEVLAGEQETGRFKEKYGEVQVKKTSGKKSFYKHLKAQRQGNGVKKGGQGRGTLSLRSRLCRVSTEDKRLYTSSLCLRNNMQE